METTKNRLLIGTRKGLVIYHRKDNEWHYQRTEFLGIPVSIAWTDERGGTWWACLDHGHWGCKLHRSDDEGQNWVEIEAPAYPEGEEAKEGKPAALRYLWAMAHGGADKPDVLYIGTEPGGLFKSTDAGKSFSLVRSLWDVPERKEFWFGGGRDFAGIHSIVVDPRDSDHIYIGISCAGVYESTDAGETWTLRNKGLKADFMPDDREVGHDPHLLVAAPSNPDVLWQQNHCGIFRSSDRGLWWDDVSEGEGPARFGFAIAVDASDENVAWVAPAVSDGTRVAVDEALTICRTDDGGKTWKDLREGLPQTGAFDITYRHALACHQNEVVFGTTTGNVYISQDRGDHWKALSHNLPMVYSIHYSA